MEKLKRYIIFFIGLYINSLGVALITKASLGTSPISSIPYVLSLNFPFTLGNFTIFFSLLLIFLQLLILRKNFKLEHVLQIPISILFGYFIDWSMILLGFVNPSFYLMKIIYLLIGCLILGFGVYTEVLAQVLRHRRRKDREGQGQRVSADHPGKQTHAAADDRGRWHEAGALHRQQHHGPVHALRLHDGCLRWAVNTIEAYDIRKRVTHEYSQQDFSASDAGRMPRARLGCARLCVCLRRRVCRSPVVWAGNYQPHSGEGGLSRGNALSAAMAGCFRVQAVRQAPAWLSGVRGRD